MRTYNNATIFDNDSVNNITFENHETITRIPTVICVKLEHWLEANHIPFKRMRKNEINDRPSAECFFDGHHYRGYFALVTNVKPEDLIKMALTFTYIAEYSEKYDTKNFVKEV